jgi:hypothetical protein
MHHFPGLELALPWKTETLCSGLHVVVRCDEIEERLLRTLRDWRAPGAQPRVCRNFAAVMG